MRRVIDALANTPHRYIVSKGPLHAEIELADNMWGAEFLPQTTIMPLVDLVITHGGNNTTTEALHFGKPMIVLPLFWDQYDNAQRVARTRARRAAGHLSVHRRRDCTARSTGCSATPLCAPAWPTPARRSAAADGLRMAADAIEKLGAENTDREKLGGIR